MQRKTNQEKEIGVKTCDFAKKYQRDNNPTRKICKICHLKGRETLLQKVQYPDLSENKTRPQCCLELYEEINRLRRALGGRKLSYTQFYKMLQGCS